MVYGAADNQRQALVLQGHWPMDVQLRSRQPLLERGCLDLRENKGLRLLCTSTAFSSCFFFQAPVVSASSLLVCECRVLLHFDPKLLLNVAWGTVATSPPPPVKWGYGDPRCPQQSGEILG